MSHPGHKNEEAELGIELLAESSPRGSLSSSTSEDLEANSKDALVLGDLEVDSSHSTSVKYAWLSALLVFGMLLTVHNKYILAVYPCPWILTGIHSLFSWLGTFVLMKLGTFRLSTLSRRNHLVMIAYSVLFSINIFFSNYSLSLVSLTFFQIIRNTSPIFTVLLELTFFNRSYSVATYISLVPMVLGAVMTGSGEIQFTFLGLFVSVIGVLLGVTKIIITDRLMTGSLALPSLELIYRMSIYASIQSFVIGVCVGELSNVKVSTPSTMIITAASLAGNGMIALLLNISSFQATKVAGALAITVWGNVRQILTLVLGILLLGEFELNLQTGAGIILVVVGCAFYSKVELDSKQETR